MKVKITLGLLLQFMIAFQLRAALFLTLVASALAAPEESQSEGVGGFFNSWFDKIFSWFGSFGSPFSTSVNIDVVEINNKSARYCIQNKTSFEKISLFLA